MKKPAAKRASARPAGGQSVAAMRRARSCAAAAAAALAQSFAYFGDMMEHCLQHAQAMRKQGRPIVGILCEYTPREIILAGGGLPVCLCGGDADTIPLAEQDLPACLCPLIKSTYGYHKQASNPFLEMADLVVAETTCDGKKKMYELMARSRPMYILELPQKPSEQEGVVHWLRELQKFRSFLEGRWSVQITDDALRDAIGNMNRERQLRRGLAELMQNRQPPLSGSQLLELKSSISCIPSDLQQYEQALQAGRELIALGGKGGSRPGKGKPRPIRMLLTGVPLVHGAERVMQIIEASGGLIVCQESCSGLKPVLEDVDTAIGDPLLALAVKYFHLPCSVMTPNDRRIESLRGLIGGYRPDCVVELIWQGCLTYDVESWRVRKLSDELHLPYLKITTDYSASDTQRLAVRIEALLETARK